MRIAKMLCIGLTLILCGMTAMSASAKEKNGDKYYVGKVMAMDAIKNKVIIKEYNSGVPMEFVVLNEGDFTDVLLGDEIVIASGKNNEVHSIKILEGEDQASGNLSKGAHTGRSRISTWDSFDPFEEMSRMQRVMNRMFNDSVGRGARTGGTMFGTIGTSFDPAIDVKDQEGAYIIVVDLPGVDRDTIDINAQSNSVTISGERSIETEEQDDANGFYRSERSFGSFQRTIPLMERIIPSKVTAETTEGVLVIELPKEVIDGGQKNKGTTVKIQ